MHSRIPGRPSRGPAPLAGALPAPMKDGATPWAGADHALVPLGRIVATPAALIRIPPEEIARALQRHQNRDWGNGTSTDHLANDEALLEGTRILSAYRSVAGECFWILTEADRSVTTVLLPEDY